MENKLRKRGTALLITLGCLALITLLILTFSFQMRIERLSAREYVATAQTSQLLQTALTRALFEIDQSPNHTDCTGVPTFSSSSENSAELLSASINFSTESDYLPMGNNLISTAYRDAKNNAAWQSISAANNVIGRIGYIAINTTGLLDANQAGGYVDEENPSYLTRGLGHDPSEIQLPSSIINEWNGSKRPYPLIKENTLNWTDATEPAMAPALAFVYNRHNAWRHFESLRDIKSLNSGMEGLPSIITTPIASFGTYSFSPPADIPRQFIGTNTVSLQTETITSILKNIPATHSEFVLNQLRDYLDTDRVPEDVNGDYTDLSVEPVPLINECILTCNLSFHPIIDEKDVMTISLTNQYTVSVEVWYPFAGLKNTITPILKMDPLFFTDPITDHPLFSNFPSDPISASFDSNSDWTQPIAIDVLKGSATTMVSSTREIVDLLEKLQTNIQLPNMQLWSDADHLNDQVSDLEIPLKDAVITHWIPEITKEVDHIFATRSTQPVEITFTTGKAVIDPRLNWDGASPSQWVDVGDMGDTATLNEINQSVIKNNTDISDPIERMYIRNADQINSPYEFTYLLTSPEKPWQTFSFFPEQDDDQTRILLNTASPHPNGPPKHGRINPYSPHKSVITAAFMSMPFGEYPSDKNARLTASQSEAIAELFMRNVIQKGWPTKPSEYGTILPIDELNKILPATENAWVAESILKNSYELFNPRDTQYTLLLVAQSGIDRNKSGFIDSDEVSATQKAIVYIWRDPVSERTACVFYGLSDTLQSSLSSDSWGQRLQAFEPY